MVEHIDIPSADVMLENTKHLSDTNSINRMLKPLLSKMEEAAERGNKKISMDFTYLSDRGLHADRQYSDVNLDKVVTILREKGYKANYRTKEEEASTSVMRKRIEVRVSWGLVSIDY